MRIKLLEQSEIGLDSYELNYKDLPFENVLREYRKKKIFETIKKYPCGRFLEIGCGLYPLFMDFMDFDKMTVVEPRQLFYERATLLSNKNPRIVIINDLIENKIDLLSQDTFDFIIVGGFLHEIENPGIVLKAIKEICSKNTIIYSFVPNARSFHRLLAVEMGIIANVYVKSGHDVLFQRHNVFDNETFNSLMTNNGFKIIDSGSYFVKPFTHDQMDKLLIQGIVEKSCLEGLEKMIKYLPDMGAELFNCCKIY